jgi:hypothetical protein
MKILKRSSDKIEGESPLSNYEEWSLGHVDMTEVRKQMVELSEEERKQRRISIDANGNKTKSLKELVEDFNKLSPNQAVTGIIQTPVYPTIGPKTPSPLDQLTINMAPTVAPLSAQQRLIELKKKITEYKYLLSIVTDATVKNFVTQLFLNIERELIEIQAELNKNPVVQPAPVVPITQPYIPYQPAPTVGLPGQPYRAGDFPGMPQETTTFGDNITGVRTTFLSNSEDGK